MRTAFCGSKANTALAKVARLESEDKLDPCEIVTELRLSPMFRALVSEMRRGRNDDFALLVLAARVYLAGWMEG